MKIHLRDALPADADFIFEVRRLAFRGYVEAQEGWNEADERRRHSERLRRQRFRIIVCEGVDVGYMANARYEATPDSPASLYLHQLMVLPLYQSRGIGARSMQLLLSEARELSLPLRLRVLRVNPRALAFYVRNGCRVVAESESHVTLEFSAFQQ